MNLVDTPAPAATSPSSLPSPSPVARVLVVDDEPGMLAMTRAILQTLGYEVVTSTSGEDAMQVFQSGHSESNGFCAVILDLAMPGGLSGVEVLGYLREVDPEIKVIASSGYLEPNSRPAARETGFAGILPKPFTAERLASELQWVLSRR